MVRPRSFAAYSFRPSGLTRIAAPRLSPVMPGAVLERIWSGVGSPRPASQPYAVTVERSSSIA